MKKGQLTSIMGIMIAVAVIVLALALAPTLVTFTDGARNETGIIGDQGLNCTSSLISDYDKGACMLIDISSPTFIITLIAIAGILVGAKLIIENVVE